jgi:selenocysteine lyase/cysteine desulfurase
VIVNAAATLTALGGSLMPAPVVAAMVEAAGSWVDLPRAYDEAGARLAELTGNEAAAVTTGAASALTLTIASLVTGPEPARLDVFPLAEPRHLLMFAGQRNDYDYTMRLLGVRIDDVAHDEAALERALATAPVAVVWFAGTQYPAADVSLERVIALAHAAGIPVVVDAAAQIPPVESLWTFTRDLGADAVVFSGGKGLGGPQDTGLALGRRDIVRGIRAHAAPNHGIGRSMKVTKESLAGIVAAVEHALTVDEAALLARYEAVVAGWIDAARAAGVPARRGFPSEAGQPHGRALIECGSPERALRVRDAMWAQEPQVAVLVTGDAVALNPQPVRAGEEDAVVAALLRACDIM